ncbi:type II CAAX prenyl endopeptidase Rce1 family protein [Nodosilinea nodulosa]|uniref:CPBP family glutamic-type intramembrane protease n=1 Tax=Nodosilinea nodulosa TaxID=416001 RepID=UPI0002E8B0E1|nr:CPBP family glutamic-type intramembrane protease [Nodosilinea nodulosa]
MLFGDGFVLRLVAQRLAEAWATGLTWPMGLQGLAGLVLYGLVALPLGLKSGFLVRQNAIAGPLELGLDALRRCIAPALVEEAVFRVMLLPHPSEAVPGDRWLLWSTVSLVVFILYHIALDKTLYSGAEAGLADPRFLALAGGLGLVLIGLYWMSGSLGLVVLVHWLVVLAWIYGFGGWARLGGAALARRGHKAPEVDR